MAKTTLERRVRIIPATKSAPTSGPKRKGKQRVAAYCRVSTNSEEQLNSYAAQKNYYTQKIQENPDWEMAGIFADEGLSGTSMKKRAEFNRMIAACKRGRIDMIRTKSASRFARNTVDCLKVINAIKLTRKFQNEIKKSLDKKGKMCGEALKTKRFSGRAAHDIHSKGAAGGTVLHHSETRGEAGAVCQEPG